jgi:hypothetical protein
LIEQIFKVYDFFPDTRVALQSSLNDSQMESRDKCVGGYSLFFKDFWDSAIKAESGYFTNSPGENRGLTNYRGF